MTRHKSWKTASNTVISDNSTTTVTRMSPVWSSTLEGMKIIISVRNKFSWAGPGLPQYQVCKEIQDAETIFSPTGYQGHCIEVVLW